MEWSNWSGHVRCHPRSLRRPGSLEGIVHLVQEVAARAGNLRVVGSGHSFSPIVATSDLLVSLDELQGLIDVDAKAQRARLWGGTKIFQIGPALAARGLSLLNQGDVHEQAIAGAVSTGTHGTGISLGSLSDATTAMTLVDGRGRVHELSASSQPELFRFARLSLGALGVIGQVELQCRPVYKLREIKRNRPLEETLDDLPRAMHAHRHFEFWWFPYSDRASIKAMDPSDDPISTSWWKTTVQETWFENAAWLAMCEATRVEPRLNGPTARLAASTWSEASRVDWAWKIFPNPRLVRFKEMEYAVPVDAGPSCLRALKAMVERERIAVNFPVEYRLVRGDDLPLSPFCGRDSAVLSVHTYNRVAHEPYFSHCERIFRDHDGRPHWGKMHSLGADALARLYPELRRFEELRRELDPSGVFQSPALRRLFPAATTVGLHVVRSDGDVRRPGSVPAR